MVAQARVIWDPALTAYDFGPSHPMAPLRLDLTTRLARSLGVVTDADLVHPTVASDDLLQTVHDPAYVASVKAASLDPTRADPAYGLGTDDDPAFVGMHEASARIVSGTVEMCRQVLTGEISHGVNYCGGMHHAMRHRASGFCIYNDIAAGIRYLLDAGVERVAYVDIDVHHGDGVEALFVDDPRVLTASIHESGRTLFPGTGWARDIGHGAGAGYAVNLPLPPGTTDSSWLRALRSSILPIVQAFRPQVLITQHGCDTHSEDPLANLVLTVDAQRQAAMDLHELAHDVSDGRWVALGGGGYAVVNVVPRAWTHLSAIALHRPVPVDTPVPREWLDHVQAITGRPGPNRMGDLPIGAPPIWVQPWSAGYNPHSPVDRAIMATREACFSHHGLDIWYD